MQSDRELFISAGNGPYANRGCEAITRGTIEILRQHFNNPELLGISHFRNIDQFNHQSANEFDSAIKHKKTFRYLKRYELNWWIHKLFQLIYPGSRKILIYKDMLPYLKEAKAVLSSGGDNYTLDYGIPFQFIDLDDLVILKKKPLIIWGASVGPFDKNPDFEKFMIKHLSKVTGIFARESATIEYLTGRGLTENVYRVADPAFLLKPSNPAGSFEIEEGSIGINLSPLLKDYVTCGDIKEWTLLSASIVRNIAQRTKRKIYLIPHVTSPHTNDYDFLKNVLSLLDKQKENAVLVGDKFNAAEIKWIISKMSVFAGARAHSVIASLSSCVPALSFAYSQKFIGINKDIFGDMRYSMSPSEISPDKAADRVDELLCNSVEIKKHLNINLPKIFDLAGKAGEYLKNIIDR